MPTTARARLAPLTYGRRRALAQTNALRRQHVRPRGESFALVTDANCETEVLAGYTTTHAPGAFVQTLRTFRESSYTIIGKPPPGFEGASSLALEEELFTLAQPAVISQVPFEVEVGKTTEVLVIGHDFKEDPLDTFSLILSTGELDTLASLGTVTFVSDPVAEGLDDLPADSTVVKVDVTVDADHTTGTAFFAGVAAFLNWRVVRS